MAFDWAQIVGAALTATVTGSGLFYAAQQIRLMREDQQLTRDEHRANEHWKRTEFARTLLEKFTTDDELAFCARALDWGVGPLVIPQKHRVLFSSENATFEHKWDVLERSVAAGLDVGWREPEALTYRYCFDAFFSYLETIKHHLDATNITPGQLAGLAYYLELFRRPQYGSDQVKLTFQSFVMRYYPSLLEFIWPELSPSTAP